MTLFWQMSLLKNNTIYILPIKYVPCLTDTKKYLQLQLLDLEKAELHSQTNGDIYLQEIKTSKISESTSTQNFSSPWITNVVNLPKSSPNLWYGFYLTNLLPWAVHGPLFSCVWTLKHQLLLFKYYLSNVTFCVCSPFNIL